MNTLPIIILALAVSAVFVAYRILSVQKAGRESLQRRYKRIQPLYDRVENEQPITTEDVRKFASNILTREATFNLLKDHDLQHLFPNEFLSVEKAGESYLANWLELPTELDGCPDQVNHVKRVTFAYDGQEKSVHY